MAFWCYILRCADGRYYPDHTDNLERRIGQHQAGGYCDFTSRRRPVEMAWCQEFPTRLEALEVERRISPWSRKKKEALIAGDWAALSYWAKPPVARPSTSLGTNGVGAVATVKSGARGQGSSTLLETNGLAGGSCSSPTTFSSLFVPSEVEAHASPHTEAQQCP